MVERAIYSYWSKPSRDNNVGFNSEEAFINCLALSLTYSKRHFKEVALVTDSEGERLIIGKYNLPFDEVSLSLDDLDNFNKIHWSLGKIKACTLQTKPFIHVDNDVILFKALPDEILNSPSSFQSLESNYYRGMYNIYMNHLKDYWYLKPTWFNVNNSDAYNAGIILFNDLSIIDDWYDIAKKYINYVDDFIYTTNIFDSGMGCLIFEQVLVKQLLDYYNIDTLLLSELENNPDPQIITDELSTKIGYTHLISNSKRMQEYENLVEQKLKLENLELYNQINYIKTI